MTTSRHDQLAGMFRCRGSATAAAFLICFFAFLAVAAPARASLDASTATRMEQALGWALGLDFTDEVLRSRFHELLGRTWLQATPAERVKFESDVRGLDVLMQLPALKREVARIECAKALLAGLRNEPDELNRFLLTAHAAAHPILVPGQPPLTLEVHDAFIGLMIFLISDGAGDSPRYDRLRARLSADLTARWGDMPVAEKQRAVRSPLGLAKLRLHWSRLGPEARQKLMAELKRGLPGTTPAARSAPERASARMPSDPQEYARMLAALQAEMASQQATTTMFSNALKMQHDASMAIINNIGDHDWEYRPRR